MRMCGCCRRCRARPGTLAAKVQTWFVFNIFVVSPIFTHLNQESLGRSGCPATSQLAALRPGLNSTGLELIVVHPGHMGSSSVALALEQLGLRTYGPYELFAFSSFFKSRGSLPAYFVGTLRACNVSAFNADDWYNLLPELVKVSPGVKILRLKKEWSRWSPIVGAVGWDVSATFFYHAATRFLFCNWLPYGLVWPHEGLGSSLMSGSLSAVLLNHCFRGVDDMYSMIGPTRQSEMAESRPAFERTMALATELVPPAQLLDFEVGRHGWRELAAFLGRPVPLEATPFPSAKRNRQLRITMLWSLFPREHLAFVVLMSLCAFVNWLFFSAGLALVARARGRSADPGSSNAAGKGKAE